MAVFDPAATFTSSDRSPEIGRSREGRAPRSPGRSARHRRLLPKRGVGSVLFTLGGMQELFDPARHQALTVRTWRPDLAHRAIERIRAADEDEFDELEGSWLLHPRMSLRSLGPGRFRIATARLASCAGVPACRPPRHGTGCLAALVK